VQSVQHGIQIAERRRRRPLEWGLHHPTNSWAQQQQEALLAKDYVRCEAAGQLASCMSSSDMKLG
jgi:hypothetical protein